MVDLSVKLGGLRLKNPVAVASGTFGFGFEYSEVIDTSSLGAIFLKTVTLEPRAGNPPPRIWETECGLLNSIGLQNPGLEKFVEEIVPMLGKLGTVVFASIGGDSADEYGALASRLDAIEDISGIEVNISCPNVARGGVEIGADASLAGEVIKAVRKSTSKPVVAKLSPCVHNIGLIAAACVEAGADGLSVANTLKGAAINIETMRPQLSQAVGGYSGPAIKPVALANVIEVYQATSAFIFGVGGISKWQDAVEFILAGASAVCVGTAIFANPRAPVDILQGVRTYMESKGLESISELRGRAWNQR